MNLTKIETTTWVGKELYYYKTIDSTNVKAAECAKDGCGHGTIILAEKQEAGRGRRGRSWSSEEGSGIYMSLVLRPTLAPQNASGLTLVAAVAVAKAIAVATESTARIKWPNDIVMNQKKVCGILTEMSLDGQEIASVVVGIGVNVHQKDFSKELADIATSIDKETGSYHSRGRLIEEILRWFEAYYEKYMQTGNLSLLKKEYEEILANKDEKVKVLDPAGEYEGIARGITKTGELIVDTGKKRHYVSSGEVSVRGIYGYV